MKKGLTIRREAPTIWAAPQLYDARRQEENGISGARFRSSTANPTQLNFLEDKSPVVTWRYER